MARVRHALISLLALLGLLVAIQPTSARVTCAMEAVATMHHHNSAPAPAPPSQQYCPVCLGVLPTLPVVEPHVLPPVAQFASQPHTLLGIDPALDPPPPRGA